MYYYMGFAVSVSLLRWLPPSTAVNIGPLGQHIEDLTQEKFSLQRALDASRALAESLAAENSSLTDNYNQQVGSQNEILVALWLCVLIVKEENNSPSLGLGPILF